MVRIPNNFGKKEEKCKCGEIENMSHIYYCETLNKSEPKISYDKIFNGNLENKIEIFRRFVNNLERRNEIIQTEN